MLEYFSYKKIKKHQAKKQAEALAQTPLINEDDEHFLSRIISAEGTPPPLPERPRSTEVALRPNNNEVGQAVANMGVEKNDKLIERKKSNRFSSFLQSRNSKKASLLPL